VKGDFDRINCNFIDLHEITIIGMADANQQGSMLR
jgi:hypothetical protein